jgi:hypothetical protein
MKSLTSLLVLPLFIFFSLPTKITPSDVNKNMLSSTFDRCTEWDSTSTYEHLYIKLCEYDSGGSGYYQFKNNYDKHVRFSFKIYHKTETSQKGAQM